MLIALIFVCFGFTFEKGVISLGTTPGIVTTLNGNRRNLEIYNQDATYDLYLNLDTAGSGSGSGTDHSTEIKVAPGAAYKPSLPMSNIIYGRYGTGIGSGSGKALVIQALGHQ